MICSDILDYFGALGLWSAPQSGLVLLLLLPPALLVVSPLFVSAADRTML